MSAPDRIGRYRIDRRVGSGGFATVWLARDEVLDAPVAVKVLADNWAHQLDVRERFLEEARILRRADSDRIVRVHDIGELEDGRPYFVMTYADGGTLADRIADGPVAVPDALRYGADVARGLAVLHEVGVIHRDVNPANVLLRSGRDGFADRVLVADLGLAKAAAHASGFTLTVGTPGYMAPEQSTGAGVSKRADVYAVGALLHHLLTGVAPSADEPLPPAASLRPEVPDAVDAVVRQAVRRRPEERYPSAGALADALDAALIASSARPRRVPVDGSGAERLAVRPPEPEPVREPVREREPALRRAEPAPEARPEWQPAPEARPEWQPAPEARPEWQPAPDDTVFLRPLPSRPRRRRRGVVIALLGVLLLVLAGGAGVIAWRARSTGTVAVSGSAATVTVPRVWAAQRQDGRSADGSQVLLVAPDAGSWGDTSSATPGVRVAVGPAGTKEADLLARGPVAGCTRTDKPWDARGLRGTAHFYTGCATLGTDLLQAVLTASDRRVVFVQIRGDPAAAGTVLASVTIR